MRSFVVTVLVATTAACGYPTTKALDLSRMPHDWKGAASYSEVNSVGQTVDYNYHISLHINDVDGTRILGTLKILDVDVNVQGEANVNGSVTFTEEHVGMTFSGVWQDGLMFGGVRIPTGYLPQNLLRVALHAAD